MNRQPTLAAHSVWRTAAALLLAVHSTVAAADRTEPQRLKRAESFLGIHFDFHASPNDQIGKNTTPEMVEKIIELVRPDYLQIDCKGHPGISSYPTKVGNRAAGYDGDPLRVWREATAKRGVALYVHYSGVWDSKAVQDHPDWAATRADGKPDERATSVFGPYAEKLLIPQLRELAGDYRIDGAWVDGDCWAAIPDFGEASQAAFRARTGIQAVPRGPGEPHWREFLEFQRQAFRDYVNRYVGEVKRTHPEFQICSNWAFSDHMPEPVTVPVDFLSGDYSPQDSVNSARLAGRFLAQQGKPWDLMAWSFTTGASGGQKTAVQLQREAAVVLALGGGFQAYHKQRHDGSIFPEQMPVMAEVAKFCRARQKLCHRGVAVPQIALLLCTEAHYRRQNGLFPRDHARIEGVLQALLEKQHSVEVLAEHRLGPRLGEYPLVVVPEWEYLPPPLQAKLKTYVAGGGNLLLIGPESAALFADELGARLAKGEAREGELSLSQEGGSATIRGAWQGATLGADAEAIGMLRPAGRSEPESLPAASVRRVGKGQIAATYFTLGREYRDAPNPAIRKFLDGIVRRLFPEPLAVVTGSEEVDVCAMRNHGQLMIHLVNTSGPHQRRPIQDSIPLLGPLTLEVRAPMAPSAVTLKPSGQKLEFTYEGGRIHVTTPPIAIHEAVVIETAEEPR